MSHDRRDGSFGVPVHHIWEGVVEGGLVDWHRTLGLELTVRILDTGILHPVLLLSLFTTQSVGKLEVTHETMRILVCGPLSGARLVCM